MSNRNPLVSVIVPAYNAAITIESVLNGLLAQTYSNIEIIVVNDGSSDDTAVIIEAVAKQDKRVKLVNQSNAGPGAARNAGLQRAQGQFVMFFDADDDFSEEIVEKLVAQQLQTRADFVFCGMVTNGSTVIPRSVSSSTNYQTRYLTLKSLLKNNLLYGPCCKLFKKSLIQQYKISFATGLKYGEDTIFVLQYLGVATNISTVTEALYYYHYTADGIAFKNRTSSQARYLRSQALDSFCDQGGLQLRLLAGLIKCRWQLSLIKSKVS